MKIINQTIALSTLSAMLSCGLAFAQRPPDNRRPDRNDRYVRHNEWRRGAHIDKRDWGRGRYVSNYRTYHLSPPPRGYQWREIDGNYVLAAVATGIIASVIVASATH